MGDTGPRIGVAATAGDEEDATAIGVDVIGSALVGVEAGSRLTDGVAGAGGSNAGF